MNLDFTMTIEEFNKRCMPGSSGETAEFELRPNDIAIKNGVKYSIKTINNEVYFKAIK